MSLKQQTKKGLYWQFLNQFSNYGIQFIIGIFMARLLSPEDYGITALPGVFMAVAGIFVGAGFGTAMVRKPELTEADLATSFYYSTAVGVVCYILLFFASPWIADFYNAPVLTPLIRITALGFIYGPIGAPQGIILTRRLDFKTPTKIGVVCKIITGIIGITMALYGFGVWALAISGMVGGIIGLILNWYVVRWYPKTGWSRESFKYLWGFGNKFMASQLLDTLYNNITPVFIGKYYSPADLGVYNRAENYAALPSKNLHGVINTVTYPVLSKIQNDDEALAHNYRRMLKVTAFVVFPIMTLLAGLARPLILIMITAKWEACIILLQIICFSMMWWPIHAINLNLLLVKGRSDLFLRLEIIKKVYGVVILAATLPLGLIVFCLGRVFSNIFGLLVNTYYTGKLINCGFLQQMKDLSPTLMLSFLVFAVSFGITLVIPNLWAQLILGGLCGAGVYLGLALLFRMKELEDVRYMLHRKA